MSVDEAASVLEALWESENNEWTDSLKREEVEAIRTLLDWVDHHHIPELNKDDA